MPWRVIATLVLVAWGSLAFGAVYSWAFVPLFAGCACLGVAALSRRAAPGESNRTLAISLVVLIAAIGVQLIPVPIGTIQRVSPETNAFLSRYQVGYFQSAQKHPLSIQPRATALAVVATSALAILLLGLARALSHADTLQIVRGVTVLGAVLAVIGIIQAALWNGRIYGFWTPIQTGLSFGPFVNRNHFAGWMLMATPLAGGYFCGRVARGMRHVKPGWRHHLLWFSSGEASETILVGAAVLLMALSVTLTTSRSGILGLLAALVIAGWFVAGRRISASRRAIVATYLVMVLLVAAGWGRIDRLAARFADADAMTFGNRSGIWSDTWRIAGDFPFAGTGINTYAVSTLFYQTVDLEKHVMAAHNDYLQLLAEGGALVCLPVGLVIVTIVLTVRRRFADRSDGTAEYWIRIGAVTGLVAIALQEIGDFSLQMPGNAVLFAVLLALAIRHAKSPRQNVKVGL
jgi:O-antigen ligase